MYACVSLCRYNTCVSLECLNVRCTRTSFGLPILGSTMFLVSSPSTGCSSMVCNSLCMYKLACLSLSVCVCLCVRCVCMCLCGWILYIPNTYMLLFSIMAPAQVPVLFTPLYNAGITCITSTATKCAKQSIHALL
jgi:hypothetical protein